MKVSTFGIKVWRLFSAVLVIGSLAWTYSLLPDLVAVDFAASGMADHYIEKSTVFYIAMGLIIVNNVAFMGMARQIAVIPTSMLPIPNKAAWADHREELNGHLTNWLYALVAAINTIVALSLFALATVNSAQYKSDIFDYAWLFYLGFGMLILIFVALPVRLMRAPAPDITLD